MSFFSQEEICEDCEHSIFHECCKKFCKCKINKWDTENYFRGTCESRIIKQLNFKRMEIPNTITMGRLG